MAQAEWQQNESQTVIYIPICYKCDINDLQGNCTPDHNAQLCTCVACDNKGRIRVGKNPGFLQKTQPNGFWGIYGLFSGFWGIFGFLFNVLVFFQYFFVMVWWFTLGFFSGFQVFVCCCCFVRGSIGWLKQININPLLIYKNIKN